MVQPGEVTQLLRAYAAGDRPALARLMAVVYEDLRRVARAKLRRRAPGQTLTTTGLVHETYLKLAAAERLDVRDRGHLMAVAARAMRQVLIGRARAQGRVKRGGGAVAVPLDDAPARQGPSPEWLLDLDRAVERLGERDPRLSRIFECRFFGGLTDRETAEALGIPLRTAQRGWLRARAWVRAGVASGAREGP